MPEKEGVKNFQQASRKLVGYPTIRRSYSGRVLDYYCSTSANKDSSNTSHWRSIAAAASAAAVTSVVAQAAAAAGVAVE